MTENERTGVFRSVACWVPRANYVCISRVAIFKVQERNKGKVSLACHPQGTCPEPCVPLGMRTGEGKRGVACMEPLSPSLVPQD